MRRLPYSLGRGAALALALIALPLGASGAGAQTRLAEEGALFLLLPVGARAVGMGQAVVADRPGSESVWWNPAGLASLDKREAAIHHSQSVVGTGDAVTVLVPSSLLGVLALSVNIFSFGDQSITAPEGTPIGTLTPRSIVYAATYATSIGSHVNAGITYKIVQLRIDCTGPCPSVPALSASTSALDLGAQYDLGKQKPLTLGFALRNLGLRLQVSDSPQADPLPTRLVVGAQYRLTFSQPKLQDFESRLGLDLVDELHLTTPSVRVGADVVWQKRAHLRLGYVIEASENSSPSLGLGLSTGNLTFDIARVFSGLSADVGEAPTYLSLRYLF